MVTRWIANTAAYTVVFVLSRYLVMRYSYGGIRVATGVAIATIATC